MRHHRGYINYVKSFFIEGKTMFQKPPNASHNVWLIRECLMFFVFIQMSARVITDGIHIGTYGSNEPTSDIDIAIIYLGDDPNFIGISDIIKNTEDYYVDVIGAESLLFDIEIYAGMISCLGNNKKETHFLQDLSKYIEINEREYINYCLPYVFIGFIRNIKKIADKEIHHNIEVITGYLNSIKDHILHDISEIYLTNIDGTSGGGSGINTFAMTTKSIQNSFNMLSKSEECRKNFTKLLKESFENPNIYIERINMYLSNIIKRITSSLNNFDFANNQIYQEFITTIKNYDEKRRLYYKYTKYVEHIMTKVRKIVGSVQYPNNLNKTNKSIFLKLLKWSSIADIFRDEDYVFPYTIMAVVHNNFFYGSNNIIYELFFILIEQYSYVYRFNNDKKQFKYKKRIEKIKKEMHIMRDVLMYKTFLIDNNRCNRIIYGDFEMKIFIDQEIKSVIEMNNRNITTTKPVNHEFKRIFTRKTSTPHHPLTNLTKKRKTVRKT
jgi:hypothetical protein